MFGREPVAIAAAIRAVILCAVLFGLHWSEAQIAGVMLVVETLLALFTRSTVTPVATANEAIAKTATTGVAQTIKVVFAALLVAGAVSACAARAGGGNVSPEGTIALRGTAVVNAINGAAPAIEALTLPNSCGQQACMTAAEGLQVATAVRKGLGYAEQLPPVLTAVDKASTAAEREAGMEKARAIVRSIQESVNEAGVPPSLQEGRLRVIAVLQSIEFALIALGGF